MDHTDDLHALAAAYALDALEPAERQRFEEHLRHCADCRADLEEFADTAALLGEAVATPAPASLRASVLSAVSRTPQLGHHDGAPSGASPTPLPAPEPGPAPRSLDAHRQQRNARRGTPTWPLSLAAACALVALAASGWAWSTWQEAERSRQVALEASQETRRIAELLTAPGSQVHSVNGRAGASATVIRAGQEAVILGTGLPEVEPGRGYQLWLIDGTDIRPAGMLEHDEAGYYTGYVADIAGVPTLGVTEEPAAGSEQPTSEPVLAADISQA